MKNILSKKSKKYLISICCGVSVLLVFALTTYFSKAGNDDIIDKYTFVINDEIEIDEAKNPHYVYKLKVSEVEDETSKKDNKKVDDDEKKSTNKSDETEFEEEIKIVDGKRVAIFEDVLSLYKEYNVQLFKYNCNAKGDAIENTREEIALKKKLEKISLSDDNKTKISIGKDVTYNVRINTNSKDIQNICDENNITLQLIDVTDLNQNVKNGLFNETLKDNDPRLDDCNKEEIKLSAAKKENNSTFLLTGKNENCRYEKREYVAVLITKDKSSGEEKYENYVYQEILSVDEDAKEKDTPNSSVSFEKKKFSVSVKDLLYSLDNSSKGLQNNNNYSNDEYDKAKKIGNDEFGKYVEIFTNKENNSSAREKINIKETGVTNGDSVQYGYEDIEVEYGQDLKVEILTPDTFYGNKKDNKDKFNKYGLKLKDVTVNGKKVDDVSNNENDAKQDGNKGRLWEYITYTFDIKNIKSNQELGIALEKSKNYDINISASVNDDSVNKDKLGQTIKAYDVYGKSKSLISTDDNTYATNANCSYVNEDIDETSKTINIRPNIAPGKDNDYYIKDIEMIRGVGDDGKGRDTIIFSKNIKKQEDSNTYTVYEDGKEVCEISEDGTGGYNLNILHIKDNVKINVIVDKVEKKKAEKDKLDFDIVGVKFKELGNNRFIAGVSEKGNVAQIVSYEKTSNGKKYNEMVYCSIDNNQDNNYVYQACNGTVEDSDGEVVTKNAYDYKLDENAGIKSINYNYFRCYSDSNGLFRTPYTIDKNCEIIYDSSLPEVKQLGGSNSYEKEKTITIQAKDDNSYITKIRYSLDEDAADDDSYDTKASDSVKEMKISANRKDVTSSFTVNDNKAVYVWCYDEAGNKSKVEKITNNNVDTVAPEFTGTVFLDYDMDKEYKGQWIGNGDHNLLIKISEDEDKSDSAHSAMSGISKVGFVENINGMFVNYDNNRGCCVVNISRMVKSYDGDIKIYAEDRAGNRVEKSIKVKVDNTPPSIDELEKRSVSPIINEDEEEDEEDKDKDKEIYNSDDNTYWAKTGVNVSYHKKSNNNGSNIAKFYYRVRNNSVVFDQKGNRVTDFEFEDAKENKVTEVPLDDDNNFTFTIGKDVTEKISIPLRDIEIKLVDGAGNTTEFGNQRDDFEKQFRVGFDNTKPNVTDFSLTRDDGGFWGWVARETPFGIFDNSKNILKATVKDDGKSDEMKRYEWSGILDLTLLVDGKKESLKDFNAKKEKDKNDPNYTYSIEKTFGVGTDCKISIGTIDNLKNESGARLLGDADTFKNNGSKDFAQINKLIIENDKPTAIIEPAENKYNNAVTVKKADPVKTGDDAKKIKHYSDDGKHWYSDDIYFKVLAEDKGKNKQSGLYEVEARLEARDENDYGNADVVSGEDVVRYEKDEDDKLVEKKYSGHYKRDYINEDEPVYEHEFYVHTANKDGKKKLDNKKGIYKASVRAYDMAYNVGDEAENNIYVDKKAPEITGFEFIGNGDKEDADANPVIERHDYGYFFEDSVKVRIKVKDEGTSSGLKQVQYYLENYAYDSSGIKSDKKIVNVPEGQDYVEFTIDKGFKGGIIAEVYDNVENVSKKVRPDDVVVETDGVKMKDSDIVFNKPDTDYRDNNGTDLYNGNVDVDLTIGNKNNAHDDDEDKDKNGLIFAGIEKVEWKIEADHDTSNNQSGTLEVDSDGELHSDSGWSATQKDKNLVTQAKKSFVIDNDSNDIMMYVRVTDRAGVVADNAMRISIDKTKPVVDVSYNNNSYDREFASENEYYKDDRTATIKVYERNFDEGRIKTEIENTEGSEPSLSNWSHDYNSSNPDKSVHTATIHYGSDGSYKFSMEATDRANNKADNNASTRFVIDKTTPTATVTFDNNDAKNGNFYKAGRTATITIHEHNFSASRYKALITSKTGASIPKTSGFSSNGDEHTAKVSFTEDGEYSFDFEFADKAGNAMSDFRPEEFVIDKTAPEVKITGIEDKSANKDEVAPVVSISDTNFDESETGYKIKLTGANHEEEIKLDGNKDTNGNGLTFSFNDFERKKEVDDIYTLEATSTDKAGNESKEQIEFSVNRFGSNYTFADNVKNYRNKYIQKEVDVIVKETNVDKIEEDSIDIVVARGTDTVRLKKGIDYTVKDISNEGNAKWQQNEYTIKAKSFAKDSTYKIQVTSKDKAGNINSNIQDDKKAELWFGVDKTKPNIIANNLKNDGSYAVDDMKAELYISDNLLLDYESVKIECNGKDVDYEKNDNDDFVFDIESMNKTQNVSIVAKDKAGNEREHEVSNFLVTTNLFFRWLHNTPLFIATITFLVVAIASSIFIIVKRKQKMKANK